MKVPFLPSLLGCLALVASASVPDKPAEVKKAVPIEETRYAKSAFRLEWRPNLSIAEHYSFVKGEGKILPLERKLREGGFQARWISVVDYWGSPLYPSKFISSPYPLAKDYEEVLKEWVEVIHGLGSPVISWYPLIFSQSGWENHPDWRQVSLTPWPEGAEKNITCCINSGYGDALLKLACEAIGRFNLDGIWFDGSAFTPIWERPLPLTCFCPSCQERFRTETGLSLPSKVDWNDPTFRKWVAWRYKVFGEYIGRLAREIRTRYPQAVVVVNHYHRPRIPWHSAIPLDLYDADIITGSEATGIYEVDTVMRLCRAYERSQSEVWRPFDLGAKPEDSADDLLHHALACFTAGGFPSYGLGSLDVDKASATAQLIAPIIHKAQPFVGGKTFPYIALWVSQQSETFYFGREVEGRGWEIEPFFNSLLRWTSDLVDLRFPPDYIYDKAFTPQKLAPYKILLLPLSPAVSTTQARIACEFAKKGGVLFLGPGAGECDEWGERKQSNPLGKELGFEFSSLYPPSMGEPSSLTLQTPEGKEINLIARMVAPLKLKEKEWQIIYKQKATGAPLLAMRQYGKGYVFLAGFDLPGSAVVWQPVVGGDTSILATEESPFQGRKCLEFIDGPTAPYSFCPDMEMRYRAFSLPLYKGGRMRFALRLGGARVQIELRSSSPPINGPFIGISEDGMLYTIGKELIKLPMGQWIQMEVDFRFSEGGKPADFDLRVRYEDKEYRWEGLPCQENGWRACDWAVIYGAGNKGRFWLDDLEIVALKENGEREVRFREEGEGLELGSIKPISLVGDLMERITRLAPPPIRVLASTGIHFGAFLKGEDLILHLHNINGHWNELDREEPKARLILDFPVEVVLTPLKGDAPLPVIRKGKHWEIEVPVPLYQIIVLKRGDASD